jgi:hypothetical protein
MPVMDRIVHVHNTHCKSGSILPMPVPGIGKVDPPSFDGALSVPGKNQFRSPPGFDDRLRRTDRDTLGECIGAELQEDSYHFHKEGISFK